jgi:hypothetical protein
MPPRLSALALLFLLCASPRSVRGAVEDTVVVVQRTDFALAAELAPGTKIRVDAPGLLSSRLIGTVVALRFDTLEVAAQVGTATGKPARWTGLVPLSAIDNLERNYGTKGHGLAGMGIGLVAGVAIANVTRGPSSGDLPDFFIIKEVLFGIGGVILGGILGTQFRTEQWEKVQIGRVGFGTHTAFGSRS